MWSKVGNVVGAAISKVQKLQNELESQLDAAVGVETSSSQSQQSQPNTGTVVKEKAEKVVEKGFPQLPDESPSVQSVEATDTNSNSQQHEELDSGESCKIVGDGNVDISVTPTIEHTDTTVTAVKQLTKSPRKSARSKPTVDVISESTGQMEQLANMDSSLAFDSLRERHQQEMTSLREMLLAENERVVFDMQSKFNTSLAAEREKFEALEKALRQEWKSETETLTEKHNQAAAKITEDRQDQLKKQERDFNKRIKELSRLLEKAEAKNTDFWGQIQRLQTQLEEAQQKSALPPAGASENSSSADVESSRAADAAEILRLRDLNTKLVGDIDAAREALSEQHAKFDALEATNSDMDDQLKAACDEVQKKSKQLTEQAGLVAKLEGDVMKLREAVTKKDQELAKSLEVVAERERALETAAAKMAETHKQLEDTQRRVHGRPYGVDCLAMSPLSILHPIL